MPANPKYLTQSKWQRFAKITAAILGGYFVSITFHLALASWFNRANILMTMAFSGFIFWVALMVIAFLAKSGWKIWGIYILLTLIFSLFIYLGQTYNPTAQ
jgi:Ca2+/Na+ antiporter